MDEAKLVNALRGKFIVLDGPDGAGKSTQRARLETALSDAGVSVVSCRDPGGTVIGDRVRSILLSHDLADMNVNCETLLFMASRAQLVATIVKPALDDGKTVLCDRFISSTCAYQGAAGYDPKRVIELARFAVDECWPDLTIILDIDPKEGFSRIKRKPSEAGKNRKKKAKAQASQGTLFDGAQTDAMEARSIEFHRRVREIFLKLHEYYPTPVAMVDGGGDADEVHQRVMEALASVVG